MKTIKPSPTEVVSDSDWWNQFCGCYLVNDAVRNFES